MNHQKKQVTNRALILRLVSATLIVVAVYLFLVSYEIVSNDSLMQTLNVLGEPGTTLIVRIESVLSLLAMIGSITALLISLKQPNK